MQNENFTAIILSYKRPQNIERICEIILTIPDVIQIIVANNNPSIDLNDFVKIKTPRLILINQRKNFGCVKRYQIAHRQQSNYFLSIDDDLFLSKVQIEYLMQKLIEDSDRPHGFWGQNYKIDRGKIVFEHGIINKDTYVDIINRAYFYTKAHVAELFKLVRLTKTLINDVGPCDDIFLSFSGAKQPLIHHIREYEDCPTSNEQGIAFWLEPGFDSKREAILQRVLEFKRFLDSPN